MATRVIRLMLYSYFFQQMSILRPRRIFAFPSTITFSNIQFQFLFRKFGLPSYFIPCEKFKFLGKFFYDLKNHSIQISNDHTSNSLLWCHWGEILRNLKNYNNCLLDSKLTIGEVKVIQSSLQNFTHHFLVFTQLYITEYEKCYNNAEISAVEENFTATYKSLIQLSVEVNNCLSK